MGEFRPSEQIDITVTEKQIFNLLLEVIKHFNLQTQIWVAGGWVRDKILQREGSRLETPTPIGTTLARKECNDIDIALDNMLGRQFCDKVNDYLSAFGEGATEIVNFPSNPDKSKHLDTARMKLFGISVDFVNLRAEHYTNNTRIPTIKFGTPAEDAFRRDLTINSLFYNISTDVVEDFTKRGISDLKSGKIRTPLPPKQTFLDDPLRVLRAIRFAARFNFVLVDDLKLAAADHDVRAALSQKISRERVRDEIDLMLSGNDPSTAMMHVADLQLFWSVFTLPNEFDPPLPEKCDRLCVSYMRSSLKLLKSIGVSLFTGDQRRLCLYAALFLPFRDTVYRENNEEKKIPVVRYICHNSLKLKSSDANAVIDLHGALHKFLSLLPFFIMEHDAESIEVYWEKETVNISTSSKLRVLTGLLLRDIKGFWRAALLLSVLLYPGDISFTESNLSEPEERKMKERKMLFKRIEEKISELGLGEVWKMKLLLNGSDIMEILGLRKGGPIVGEWKQTLFRWQLAHPSGTADAFRRFVQNVLGQFDI